MAIIHNELDQNQIKLFDKNKGYRKKRSNCTSKYMGVSLNSRARRWAAKISVSDDKGNRRSRHLGTFPLTPEGERQAALAYDKIAIVFGLSTNILKPLARSSQ